MFNINVKVTPLPRPVGLIYTMRFQYRSNTCTICSKTKDKLLTVNIGLVMYFDSYDKKEECYSICLKCYKKSISLCKKLFKNKDMMPLYINDANIFIRHFVEKALKS